MAPRFFAGEKNNTETYSNDLYPVMNGPTDWISHRWELLTSYLIRKVFLTISAFNLSLSCASPIVFTISIAENISRAAVSFS